MNAKTYDVTLKVRKVIIRVGRRVLLDEAAFFVWVKEVGP